MHVISNYPNDCADIHGGVGFERVCQGAAVGRRATKDREGGCVLKALSVSQSDGLSTKHSCFRRS